MAEYLLLLAVLIIPFILFYYIRSENRKPNTTTGPPSEKAKNKKKKQKKKTPASSSSLKKDDVVHQPLAQNAAAAKASTTSNIEQRDNSHVEDDDQNITNIPPPSAPSNPWKATGTKQRKANKKNHRSNDPSSILHDSDFPSLAEVGAGSSRPFTASSVLLPGNNKVPEIDPHMDPTPRFARVLRIKPEDVQEDDWDNEPVEDGWDRIRKAQPSVSTSKASSGEQTKKQRENAAREGRKKAEKMAKDAEQAERLRRHQKELEGQRINEFYKSGPGKALEGKWKQQAQQESTSGSGKKPTAVAGISEEGHLIWD